MGVLLAGRYEIVRELGRGGMGEVLLAKQVNLGRLVVIKRVLPEHASKHVRALLDEARLAARLHHPCIVSVLDVHPEQGVEPAFITMEYVAGVTLREVLHRAPDGLRIEVALQIALDVLRGLDHAHGVRNGEHVGVVHRDIKPRNLMVTFAGDTKIIDFGISRWLAGDGGWESTSVSGTRGYMAPEQQQGKRVDGRADQYAVGIVLREMITGVSPRESEITRDERAHPAGAPARSEPPPELAAIIDRACALDPELRYPDCASLASTLEAYAARLHLSSSALDVERWMREHLGERIEAWESDAQRASEPSITLPPAVQHTLRTEKPLPEITQTASPTLVSDEHRTPPPTRRSTSPARRRWPLVAAIGLVSVAAGTGIALWSRHRAPAPPSLVALAVVDAERPGDGWLDLAVGHVVWRTLRDVTDRRFPLAGENDARPARMIEIVYRHGATGLQLEARRRGDDAVIARAAGSSVFEAAEALAAPLAAALGEGVAEGTDADADEHAAMTAIGARSIAEYRRFRTLAEQARLAGWVDSSLFAQAYEALARDDPAWAHPYTELFWLLGAGSSPAARTALETARMKVTPGRDPGGEQLLAALAKEAAGANAEVERITTAVFQANNADMLAGETLWAALNNMHRSDEARAVFRRLQEQYPALYFAADVAIGLVEEGRGEHAEHLVREALAANPENLTAAREVVRFEVGHGRVEEARREAGRALLVHGERPAALAEMFEMMVLADDLAEAQRVADRMLLGSPLARARGRYRNAVIAVFEGRFAAGEAAAEQAVREYGTATGEDSEVAQALVIRRQLGDPAAALAATTALAAWLHGVSDHESEAVYRYRAALMAPRARCPDPSTFLGELDPEDHTEAMRDITRSAALAGCATCKAVLAAGFSSGEVSGESLVAHGDCAMREHDLATAKRAYTQATQLWSSWWSNEASPYHAVLAHARLASVLAAEHDLAGARREYERFLAAWGHADQPIAAVDEARTALAALPR